MTHRPRATVVLAVAFLAAHAVPAGAKHPCAADVQRLCPDVPRDGGALVKCLRAHESELSDACKAARDATRHRAHDAFETCRGDAASLCKDVKAGGGRVMRCLDGNREKLSAGCQKAITDLKQR